MINMDIEDKHLPDQYPSKPTRHLFPLAMSPGQRLTDGSGKLGDESSLVCQTLLKALCTLLKVDTLLFGTFAAFAIAVICTITIQ
ncbi:MAG: hypothetical protein CSA81_07030 [Acidobacteria bacterium]|nr:MAG: hypothetical protein CSA81_07030 [Acidobacteriota bacterium]